jgi:hypothetical protein
MPEFLLELYVSGTARGSALRGAERARIAADELTRAGTPVSCLRSIFVPADETFFLLYEADSLGVVQEAARLAGLSFDRIAEALTERRGGSDEPSVSSEDDSSRQLDMRLVP